MSESRAVPNSTESVATGPAVALVMKLGGTVDAGVVSRLASRLASDQMVATWAVSDSKQLNVLRNVKPAGRELALDVSEISELRIATEKLAQLQETSKVESLLASETQLRRYVALASGANITAALVEDAASKGPRQAGPGLWRFATGIEFPIEASWPRLFSSRSAKSVSDVATGGVAAVKIDMQKLAGSSAGQKQVDRLLTKLAWAQNNGTVVTTLSDLAAIYAARTEVRPQRSILRAA
ncbi:hypothetical protein [Adhaeretor mobilis]|uniref:Uncharacterized protein n=1 Tax=Adhaeretor mobilis TaxID=1930276 RepID=A0A517N0K5_9BACT|nr:hypothetical protein [Adhaeretor mobilis]QDT00558.1 hypothetical protein HG15A2_38960 [Adhaeretor mobilis]